MLKILKGWKLTSPPQVKYDEDFKPFFHLNMQNLNSVMKALTFSNVFQSGK